MANRSHGVWSQERCAQLTSPKVLCGPTAPNEDFTQLWVVSSYTNFSELAHGPKGTEAKCSMYTFSMDRSDGQMVLLSVSQEPTVNPAFSRFHPYKNVLYSCTESVSDEGRIDSWEIDPRNGQLSKIGSLNAGGTSTCYITLDKECENMLVVNYWNATIGVFGLNGETGEVNSLRSAYDPNEGRPMKARHDKHVNHSENDMTAQKERQSDPHSHAIILDPFFGCIAYVPDLGMDLIRQFLYNAKDGTLQACGSVPSGPAGREALGPRYIEFHPRLPVAYVVNELSSEVSVFEFDWQEANALACGSTGLSNAKPTLRLVQTVRTVPEAFPSSLNTCGRITVHSTGNFVLVSNRGHDSITVFRVHQDGPRPGLLSVACMQHTRGATPRHFAFDGSGHWLLIANQDSDSLGVFRFNLATGKLEFTGHEYSVPSPNFVCSIMPHAGISAEDRFEGIQLDLAKLDAEAAALRNRRRSHESLPAPPVEAETTTGTRTPGSGTATASDTQSDSGSDRPGDAQAGRQQAGLN